MPLAHNSGISNTAFSGGCRCASSRPSPPAAHLCTARCCWHRVRGPPSRRGRAGRRGWGRRRSRQRSRWGRRTIHTRRPQCPECRHLPGWGGRLRQSGPPEFSREVGGGREAQRRTRARDTGSTAAAVAGRPRTQGVLHGSARRSRARPALNASSPAEAGCSKARNRRAARPCPFCSHDGLTGGDRLAFGAAVGARRPCGHAWPAVAWRAGDR